ncbi:PRKR-interacting protein 1 homolog [Anopheles aquasalis]|uniref:PRKR-interacting protein 1 homolog n=1 Tax=Anopheles aquasalis TaxID=42839 RepID=UPI00215B4426|nr:PRKR-interacting protein 1 homolog [Anopheles aquasalis]
MEIRNEVKPSDKEVEKKKFVVRSAADIQRAKLEKLMKNPDKPVIIPTSAKDRDFSNAIPSFVRNVMGSSAGAGSGEFHVYRHLRRKEYARQKQIQEKSRSEQLDDDFQQKLENNRKAAEDRTAKKRAKRLKKKAKQKANRGKKPKIGTGDDEEPSSEDNESDENEGESQKSETESSSKVEEESSGERKGADPARADDTDGSSQPETASIQKKDTDTDKPSKEATETTE